MLPFRYLLVLVTVLAFIFPQPGILGKDLLIWALSGSILFALLGSKQKFAFDTGAIKEGIVYGYALLSGAVLIVSFFCPPEMKDALILYALFPPAISVIPLSQQWGGNPKNAFLFLLLSYAVSIVAIPAASQLLIGEAVDSMVLLKYLAYSFAIPVVIAYFVNMKEKELANDISNVLLALLFYIILATNVDGLLSNFSELLPYFVSLLCVSFAITYAVYRFVRSPDAVLYSFMKNGGAAAGVASLTLPPFAAVVISVKVFIDIILIVFFERALVSGKK